MTGATGRNHKQPWDSLVLPLSLRVDRTSKDRWSDAFASPCPVYGGRRATRLVPAGHSGPVCVPLRRTRRIPQLLSRRGVARRTDLRSHSSIRTRRTHQALMGYRPANPTRAPQRPSRCAVDSPMPVVADGARVTVVPRRAGRRTKRRRRTVDCAGGAARTVIDAMAAAARPNPSTGRYRDAGRSMASRHSRAGLGPSWCACRHPVSHHRWPGVGVWLGIGRSRPCGAYGVSHLCGRCAGSGISDRHCRARTHRAAPPRRFSTARRHRARPLGGHAQLRPSRPSICIGTRCMPHALRTVARHGRVRGSS